MIKKLLLFVMTLACALPIWAGEQTVVINRNEGQFEEANGVYYCYKGGLMMTFTSGLNNPNYLVEHQQVYFEVRSVNQSYIIKKIVFHCVDNTTSDNLDCFYWGPSTISIVQNWYNQSEPGTYTYSGYTGTWRGETNKIQFTTMAKPVRFGSVEITYEKETGDIYDLVTSSTQLQAGEKYVIVNQSHDMAMSTALQASFEQQTMDTVGISFVDDSKMKVIINPEVQIFTLRNSGETTRPWVFQLTGSSNYLRRNSTMKGTNNYNKGYALYYEGLNSTYSPVTIAIGDASGDPYNARIRFKRDAMVNDYNDTCAISYVNSYSYFRTVAYSSWNTYESSQRVYLYMPARNYEITTECDPTAGGFITLGEGVLEIDGRQTSQQFQTVSFFVGTNEGYGVGTVSATDSLGNPVALTCTSTTALGRNYTFTMPASDVHIVATFVDPYEIHTECTPEYGGVFDFTTGAVDLNNKVISNEGNSVTFTITPSLGYVFTGLTATDDSDGSAINLIDNGNGSYTFTMPGNDVTLSATFDRVIGDIFDLVTSGSQIVEGATYIIVSQNHDKVMRHWNKSENTFQGTPIVEWVTQDKSKVRVDDNACFFRLDDLYLNTANNYRSAYMNTLVGYLGYSGYNGTTGNVVSTPDMSGFNRATMYISGAANGEKNYLCTFDSIKTPNRTIRYEVATNSFKIINYNNSTDERVWLYKLAESYHNISTICTPPEGGSITNVATSAQENETVTFTVNTNQGYTFTGVTVTYTDGTTGTINVTDNGHGNYSFTMPDAAVTITANFDALYVITTYCDPTNAGRIDVYDGITNVNNTIYSTDGTTVTFWVEHYNGYYIAGVTATNLDTGEEIQVNSLDSNEYGQRFNFEMPAGNVHIVADFAEKLYLLGTVMGRTNWAPSGPEFSYDTTNDVYTLDVYFKGGNDDVNANPAYGYFSLSKHVTNFDWTNRNNNSSDWSGVTGRLVAQYNGLLIEDGDTQTLYPASYQYSENNAFMIPAGIYRIIVNKAMNEISVEKIPVELTLTPEGGTTAADPVYVTYNQPVTASSDLETEVHAVASLYGMSEDNQQFNIKQDDAAQWTSGNTTNITKEGTTKVTGEAYIGYIRTENSAYYAYTPLSYIERDEENKVSVVVCDDLVGTWAVVKGDKKYLWAKDDNRSNFRKADVPAGQIDYVTYVGVQKRDWDQSNWVILDFSEVNANPEDYLNQTLNALTVKGTYADKVNHRILLSDVPDYTASVVGYPGYNGDYNETSTHPDSIYYYNQYLSFNFLDKNLVDAGAGPGNNIDPSVDTSMRFYFMNPKTQEVAHIMGVWIGGNYFSSFVTEGTSVNGYDLDGIFKVNWDYNRIYHNVYDTPQNLIPGTMYSFHGAVYVDDNSGNKLSAGKPNSGENTPDGYTVYPFDLPTSPSPPTAVVEVSAGKSIESVRYYNIMGAESNVPFQGVNIMVVRFDDGTTSSIKIIR